MPMLSIMPMVVGRPSPCGDLGDVDGDGLVTENDANMVAQYTVGGIDLTEDQMRRANVNGGILSVGDARDINYYANGSIDTFSACNPPLGYIPPPPIEPLPILLPVLDVYGCDTSDGHTWCPRTQMCHIESTDPCNPIEPVIIDIPPYIPPYIPPIIESESWVCEMTGGKWCPESHGCVARGRECPGVDDLCYNQPCSPVCLNGYCPPGQVCTSGGCRDKHGCVQSIGELWCERTLTCMSSDLLCNPDNYDEHDCKIGNESWCEYYKECRDRLAPLDKYPRKDCVHGCETSDGKIWCDVLQQCISNNEMCELIPQPECTPIADKPYRCGGAITGINPHDRYDCVNGLITLTEEDSTSCGFPVPVAPEPTQTLPQEPASSIFSNPMALMGVLGIALIGGFIMLKGDK